MHQFGTLRPKWTYNHSVARDTYVHTYTSNWSHTTCQCGARSGLAPIKQILRINDTRYSYIPLQLYKSAHILYRHLTTFHCCHIPVPCLTTDWCPICRPHSDPVHCSWFQTTQCDTSAGLSYNPLILWSHHCGSSKVLSLIAHISPIAPDTWDQETVTVVVVVFPCVTEEGGC